MNNIEKIRHEGESVLAKADISKTFYTSIASLYLLGFVLLFIGYEYEIGFIGAVLVIRTFYVNLQEIKEKKSYNCLLTQNRLIIVKGHKIKEPYLYHKAIIGDIVSATHYSNKNKKKNK